MIMVFEELGVWPGRGGRAGFGATVERSDEDSD
jgi:hypothetical protein